MQKKEMLFLFDYNFEKPKTGGLSEPVKNCMNLRRRTWSC